MIRLVLCVALSIAALACSSEGVPVHGIETRMTLDRTELGIGDQVGVTIVIDTPRGYAVASPDPPSGGAAFLSERVEVREPVQVPGGLRHRLLWTLRAKEVGEHALPMLAVPLTNPEGHMEPLPVGGTPLAVRSTREALPHREVFFDIRAAPAPQSAPLSLYLGGAVALVLACVAAAVWFRRTRGVLGATADPQSLARDALAGLEAALTLPVTRERASRASDALRTYTGLRFTVRSESATPRELPDTVEPELVELLSTLDGERFAPDPHNPTVDDAGNGARRYLRDVVDG